LTILDGSSQVRQQSLAGQVARAVVVPHAPDVVQTQVPLEVGVAPGGYLSGGTRPASLRDSTRKSGAAAPASRRRRGSRDAGAASGSALGIVEPRAFGEFARLLTDHPASVIFGSAILAGWLMGLLSWLVAATGALRPRHAG
jgi:hypothetical protein